MFEETLNTNIKTFQEGDHSKVQNEKMAAKQQSV